MHWFVLKLQNSSSSSKRALLEFSNIDGVGWVEETETGELNIIEPLYDSYIGGRQIFDTAFVVPVELGANSSNELIGYVYTVSIPRLGSVIAWEPETFRAQRAERHFSDGIYYGFIFALVIYNLALAVVMRQIAYSYAGIFQFCIGAIVFLNSGYSSLFLIPNNIAYTVPLFGIISITASTCGGLFSISVLPIKQHNLFLYKIWVGLIAFSFIQLPLVALTSMPGEIYPNSNRFLLTANAIVFLASLGVQIYTLAFFWRRVTVAKYWFVAVTLQAWIVMAWTLSGTSGINFAELFRVLVQIFTLINGVILSWLVNNTVREQERNRESAQQEAFANLQMANDIQRSKANFISTAGHDLRQPLEAIRLHIEALRQVATSTTSKVLSKVENNISELSALLGSLMNLSKSTNYIDRDNDEEFLLDEVLNGLKEEMEPFTAQKGIELNIDAAPFLIRTNKIALSQILRNLLNNSLKFTREGSVKVRVEHIDTSVAISVEDTGPGIAKEEISKIFEEFYQIENNLDSSGEGMGVGLSIVKRLSDTLNIPVQVESTLGEGTRFTLELNIVEPVKIQRGNITDPFSLSGLRVAVVHGSDQRCIELKTTIEKWGAMALSWNALESLENYKKRHAWYPHLVIIEDAQLEEYLANTDLNARLQAFNSAVIVLSEEGSNFANIDNELAFKSGGDLVRSKIHWFKDPLPPGVLRSFIQRIVIKAPT